MSGVENVSPPDWRGLVQELLDCLDSTSECRWGEFKYERSRARAALSQPEPEVVGPSDEELAGHLISAGVDAMEGEPDGTGRMYWEGWNEQVMAAMRAAIAADRARWGRPAPAPAGEVE